MRLPLAADLQSRDGTIDQDSHLTNSYVEGSAVFSRPGAIDLGAVGSGVAQGMGELRQSGAAVVSDSLRIYTVSGSAVTVNTTASLSPLTAALPVTLQESGETQTTELMLKTEEQGWIYTP